MWCIDKDGVVSSVAARSEKTEALVWTLPLDEQRWQFITLTLRKLSQVVMSRFRLNTPTLKSQV